MLDRTPVRVVSHKGSKGKLVLICGFLHGVAARRPRHLFHVGHVRCVVASDSTIEDVDTPEEVGEASEGYTFLERLCDR